MPVSAFAKVTYELFSHYKNIFIFKTSKEKLITLNIISILKGTLVNCPFKYILSHKFINLTDIIFAFSYFSITKKSCCGSTPPRAPEHLPAPKTIKVSSHLSTPLRKKKNLVCINPGPATWITVLRPWATYLMTEPHLWNTANKKPYYF